MKHKSTKSFKSFFELILKEKESALNYMEWMLYTMSVYPSVFYMTPQFQSELQVIFDEKDSKPYIAFKLPGYKVPKRLDSSADVAYLNVSNDIKNALRKCFQVYEKGNIKHLGIWADYLFSKENLYEITNEEKYTSSKYNAFNSSSLIRGLTVREDEIKECDIGLFWHTFKPVVEEKKYTYTTVSSFIDVQTFDKNVMNCYQHKVEFKYIDKKAEELIDNCMMNIINLRKSYNIDNEMKKLESSDIDNIVNAFTEVLYSSSLIPSKKVMKKKLMKLRNKQISDLIEKNLLYRIHDICDDVEQIFYKIGKSKLMSLRTFMMTNEMTIKEIDHPHYMFFDRIHKMRVDMKDDMLIAFVENVEKDKFKYVEAHS